MKIELKHISPYVPYKLKGDAVALDGDIEEINQEVFRIETGGTKKNPNNREPFLIVGDSEIGLEGFKPILIPLSDINKEFKFRGMLCNMSSIISCSKEESEKYLQEAKDNIFDTEDLKWWQFERLLQYHFDVFNLIPEGLAIDINTLES